MKGQTSQKRRHTSRSKWSIAYVYRRGTVELAPRGVALQTMVCSTVHSVKGSAVRIFGEVCVL